MEQTAVEWLVEQLPMRIKNSMMGEIEQAKELGFKQRMKAIDYGIELERKNPTSSPQTDENGKPLTYWGGWLGKDYTETQKNEERISNAEIIRDVMSSKTEIKGYICPVTGLQCDDECCTSPENCNIDNEKLEYPVSDDCEEVKNWDSFVEQKNNELDIDKLAESYVAEDISGKLGKYLVKSCYIDGYKKAKETLYTMEQVREAIELAMDFSQISKQEISDEEIYKASREHITDGGGAQGWIEAAFRQGAVWYREQIKLK